MHQRIKFYLNTQLLFFIVLGATALGQMTAEEIIRRRDEMNTFILGLC